MVGHNEEGRFKFLNSESTPLWELAQDCKSAHKLCVFFSCDAQTYFRQYRIVFGLGADSQLNYLEAAQAAKCLDQFLESHGTLDDRGLMAELPAAINCALGSIKLRANCRLIVGGTASAAVVLGVIVYLESTDNSD